MIEKSDQGRGREIERRKIFLEMVQKAFPEAEVEGISLPQINRPDGWEVAIRLKKPGYRSIIIRPRRPLMTDTKIDFIQLFEEGIQEAKKYLDTPPFKDKDFQGTILLNNKGVEGFLKGAKADLIYL
jgi:hypothetical protein